MSHREKRFWVSWWSTYHAERNCTKPEYKFVLTGYRSLPKDEYDKHGELIDECSLCAVFDADDEQEIWDKVKINFPDFTPRFCEEKDKDFVSTR